MTRIFLTLVAIATTAILSSCTSTGEKTSLTPAPSSVAAADSGANAEQEVRAAHQEYDRAWLQQDVAAFDRLLADDATQIDPEGKVLSKAEILANAKSGDLKLEVGQSDDVKIRVYGNTAVVSAHWTEKSTDKGKPFAGTMRNVAVYVKKNGRWQVVSDQVTAIAGEPKR